jgi:hypothetical protein
VDVFAQILLCLLSRCRLASKVAPQTLEPELDVVVMVYERVGDGCGSARASRASRCVRLTRSVDGKEPEVNDEVTSRHPRLRVLLVQIIVERPSIVEDLGDIVPRSVVRKQLVAVDGQVGGVEGIAPVERDDPVEVSIEIPRVFANSSAHMKNAMVMPMSWLRMVNAGKTNGTQPCTVSRLKSHVGQGFRPRPLIDPTMLFRLTLSGAIHEIQLK